jgi:SAM-dependent methyltransferase
MSGTLFKSLRERIRSGECRGKAFRAMVSEYAEPCEDDFGYDDLDVFIGLLFSDEEMPLPTRELEPEMVEYYKTPARVVFDLVDRFGVTAEDVFVDVGSGLGQAAILVNLLTGARARGIEIEPAYCAYARDCAARLGLRDVEFITADAREADLSEGTVFFLYTPFRGNMMLEVLGRLRTEGYSRRIRIIER